jgi:pimeloyl-ACP methyl ester carboxylesterase
LLPQRFVVQKVYFESAHRIFMPDLNRARAETLRMIDERGFPAPTLVVWGQNDLSAPIRLAQLLFDRIAAKTERAEFHIFNHARHYPYRDHPDRFNRLVTDFCLG